MSNDPPLNHWRFLVAAGHQPPLLLPEITNRLELLRKHHPDRPASHHVSDALAALGPR